MKKIGIWIDKLKAHVITISDKKEEMTTIFSNVETYHIGGGSGSKLKGGPQDVKQDSKYLERQKNSFKKYFKEIASYLKDADSVVIFGPAETGEKLNKKLQKKFKLIGEKVKDVIKTDSMTLNQTKALVRDYFKKEFV